MRQCDGWYWYFFISGGYRAALLRVLTGGMHFHVKLPLFPVEVLVSVNQTDAEFKPILRAWLPKGHSLTGLIGRRGLDGYAGTSDQGCTVLRIYPDVNAEAFHSVVAHEIFHAAVSILDYCGVFFQRETSEEVYAHLIGYLTKVFYENYHANLA